MKTLDTLNDGIFDAIRHYSISHSLDPTNNMQHRQQSDEELSEFEQIERTIRDRERAIELYQQHLNDSGKHRFEETAINLKYEMCPTVNNLRESH